jgi:hypothetical protein
MGIFNSKIENIVDLSMNENLPEKLELRRIHKKQGFHHNKEDNISYSGKLNNKDQFTYVIINDKLQCIIPENIIKYSDVNQISNILELVKKKDHKEDEEFTYKDYEKIKIVQKLSDKIKMLTDRDNKIDILEHFTI